jgi:hypothetical protein
MKKTMPKKLTLSRETLGTLTEDQAKEVKGGAIRPTTNSVDACCA